jgi:hypothetical protein
MSVKSQMTNSASRGEIRARRIARQPIPERYL